MSLNLNPEIRINVASIAAVERSTDIRGLTVVAGKLRRLTAATDGGTVARLATATGDLAASIQYKQDTRSEFADEVAGVILAALIAADAYGVDGDEIASALQSTIAHELQKGIAGDIHNLLDKRESDHSNRL